MRSGSGYYYWLLTRFDDTAQQYSRLLEQMYETNYIWIYNLDYNRAEAGKNLRRDFLWEQGIDSEDLQMDADCSVLEMLIAVVDTVSNYISSDFNDVFWEIVNNLGLKPYTDNSFDSGAVNQKLYSWMYGNTCMFDLPGIDWKKLSIWDQMNCYMNQKGIATNV